MSISFCCSQYLWSKQMELAQIWNQEQRIDLFVFSFGLKMSLKNRRPYFIDCSILLWILWLSLYQIRNVYFLKNKSNCVWQSRIPFIPRKYSFKLISHVGVVHFLFWCNFICANHILNWSIFLLLILVLPYFILISILLA